MIFPPSPFFLGIGATGVLSASRPLVGGKKSRVAALTSSRQAILTITTVAMIRHNQVFVLKHDFDS
jgi:hypothetical protein